MFIYLFIHFIHRKKQNKKSINEKGAERIKNMRKTKTRFLFLFCFCLFFSYYSGPLFKKNNKTTLAKVKC